MRFTQMGLVPQKEAPKDADTVNHRLLVQAGFVRRLMAGVYVYLPLGLRVLRKVSQIIREEMDAIGALEVLMPSLHPAANWQKTGAWDGVDVLFKLKSRTGRDYALGQSHEEIVTPLVGEMIKSYRDLPIKLYQVAWKFRDELRSKSGVLRGREFLMKDMYSFHVDQADFDRFYNQVKNAYITIFERMGLVAKVTEASGGGFSQKISYEFMVLTDAGEDDILYCPTCEFCVNVEIAKQSEGDVCPKCSQGELSQARASEVGNVFDLGQKYTKDFEVTFTGEDGVKSFPIMGCYGIGVSRTMGVMVEKLHDERGIIWPVGVAPFQVHLVSLGETSSRAEAVYKALLAAKVEVIWDDRDEPAGVKLADADLIGVPVRLVVSPKTAEQVEWKDRDKKATSLLSIEQVIKKLRA